MAAYKKRSQLPAVHGGTVQRCRELELERRMQTWFVQEPSRAEEAVRALARAAGMQHGKTEALLAYMRTQLEVDLTPWQERFLGDWVTWTRKGLPSFAGALLPRLGEGVDELNRWQLEFLIYILELDQWPWRA